MESMDEFLATLDVVAKLPLDCTIEQRESADADVCLASRTAYFDLYTEGVIKDGVAFSKITALRDALERAMFAVRTDRFHESIEDRYEDFRAFCSRIREKISDTVPYAFDEWMKEPSGSSSWSSAA